MTRRDRLPAACLAAAARVEGRRLASGAGSGGERAAA